MEKQSNRLNKSYDNNMLNLFNGKTMTHPNIIDVYVRVYGERITFVVTIHSIIYLTTIKIRKSDRNLRAEKIVVKLMVVLVVKITCLRN